MDIKEFFLERYSAFQDYPEYLLEGMTEKQIRESPDPSLNPIAWLLWHAARSEDIGVNRLLVDGVQVFTSGPWRSLRAAEPKRFGTGMTKEEVGALSSRINLSELKAYRSAVFNQTIAVVNALDAAKLDDLLTKNRLRTVFDDEGVGGDAADWLVDMYADNTKGWLLGHLALTHNYYHIGQAATVRKLFGLENRW